MPTVQPFSRRMRCGGTTNLPDASRTFAQTIGKSYSARSDRRRSGPTRNSWSPRPMASYFARAAPRARYFTSTSFLWSGNRSPGSTKRTFRQVRRYCSMRPWRLANPPLGLPGHPQAAMIPLLFAEKRRTGSSRRACGSQARPAAKSRTADPASAAPSRMTRTVRAPSGCAGPVSDLR